MKYYIPANLQVHVGKYIYPNKAYRPKPFLLLILVIIIMTDQIYLTVNAVCQEKGYNPGCWTIQQGSSKGTKAISYLQGHNNGA